MSVDARRLLERYHDTRDGAIRDELVVRFLPLVRRVAMRYHRGGAELDDLTQVASIGLLKAIDRFDPARGTAFSSFAVPTMVGEIKRYFRDTGWAVRVPRSLQEQALRVERVTRELERERGRPPTLAEVADRAGTTVEEALEARDAALAHRAVALDRLPVADDARVVAETLGAAEEGYSVVEDSVTVEWLLSALGDRDREILLLRFRDDLTQREIGERVGLSQMHVSRLIRHAVEQLRESADPALR